MEPNFQTSFIPKKPVVEERVVVSHPIGIFMILALFLMFAVVIVSGGLYFYKGFLANGITSMDSQLNLARNQFEPDKINQLQQLDKRLSAATQVLSKHVAVSPIFKALEDITLKTVRYTNFSYIYDGTPGSKVQVKMSGTAVGYLSIALQSDLFPKNKALIDPVFSNLALDDKGNVNFDLDFSVDPSFVDYKQTISTQ